MFPTLKKIVQGIFPSHGERAEEGCLRGREKQVQNQHKGEQLTFNIGRNRLTAGADSGFRPGGGLIILRKKIK